MVTNQAGILLSLFVFVQSPKSHEGSKSWSLVANEPPTGWTEQFFFSLSVTLQTRHGKQVFFTGSLQQSWCRGPESLFCTRFSSRCSNRTRPLSSSSTQGLFPLGAFNDVCAATRVTSLTLSDMSACGIYVCFLCCTRA